MRQIAVVVLVLLTVAVIAGTLAVLRRGSENGGGTQRPIDSGQEKDNGGGPVIEWAPEPVKVVFEAEAGEVAAPFSIEENADCSAGKCLLLPEIWASHGELHPKLRKADGAPVPYKPDLEEKKWLGTPLYPNGLFKTRFEINEPGEYTLWARAWWHCGCGNSFYFLIDPKQDPVDSNGNGEYDDDIPARTMGEDGTYEVWHWVQYGKGKQMDRFKLDAGEHVLAAYNREDGIRVDQFLLLKYDPEVDYAPSGIEEAE